MLNIPSEEIPNDTMKRIWGSATRVSFVGEMQHIIESTRKQDSLQAFLLEQTIWSKQ